MGTDHHASIPNSHAGDPNAGTLQVNPVQLVGRHSFARILNFQDNARYYEIAEASQSYCPNVDE
jgi:hypothetical protein